MNPLQTKRIFIFRQGETEIEGVESAGLPIAAQGCHSVSSYQDLLKKIAALNFYNSSLHLYYRGQDHDYQVVRDKSKVPIRSNLYPKILRNLPSRKGERSARIAQRTDVLRKADSIVRSELSDGYIHRHRLVRWAILQHYEVCATPLLDVTSSLQIALSFAVPTSGTDGFLFVLGLPHQSGPISTSVESMTQIVDLAKICPPQVTRPHFQSAAFLADYPLGLDIDDLVQKAPRVDANFACRLLTKFRLIGLASWQSQGFVATGKTILFPNAEDELFPCMERFRKALAAQTSSPSLEGARGRKD